MSYNPTPHAWSCCSPNTSLKEPSLSLRAPSLAQLLCVSWSSTFAPITALCLRPGVIQGTAESTSDLVCLPVNAKDVLWTKGSCVFRPRVGEQDATELKSFAP